MSQPSGKYLMFYNRLQKVYKHLNKQASRQGISCFRIYDHDLPEFPLIIELYEQKVYVSEYKRKHALSDEEHDAWLTQCQEIIAEVTTIPVNEIYVKLRKRKEDRKDQYQKLDQAKNETIVHEGGLKFIVNLSDYLDTGLFLDHRITRGMVKEIAGNKKVLNLFCYTGSFSVYAIAGGAGAVTSVDLSKTYLDWTERNVMLNFPEFTQHQAIHADVKQYLKEAASNSFDIIVMDPPTFSNSKRMEDILDIQRDHVELINDCMQLLTEGGILFFSTNYRKFQLDRPAIKANSVKDITKATTPFDFAGKLHRQCFSITK
ncbi:class I SAM-dependent methyltransferase [Flavisolibacter tropicus]|uniref:SAM-dependent methlyltransferase n=1 Tax=Flavisolibacter tropicus TaxID=1492898 RepID=A0A172U0H0_9BACT|nr:class I SAM-dependent methyltransferase [Flavisolibacter tropicus]ANE52859.1 SAM-dependent methlyltransferase [Flavisolibacter tropicus]